MANGATQTSSRLQFKPRKPAKEVRPDAPEGEWEAIIPKGKCKAFVTAPEKGSDPGISIAFKLVKAADEKNADFQNAEVSQRVTFYAMDDADRRKAANMNLQFMRNLCEAVDLEFSDVYPDEISSENDLKGIISQLEGKKLTVWTVHRKSTTPSGEEMTNVDVRFRAPGAGMATRKADEGEGGEEDDRPGRRNKRR